LPLARVLAVPLARSPGRVLAVPLARSPGRVLAVPLARSAGEHSPGSTCNADASTLASAPDPARHPTRDPARHQATIGAHGRLAHAHARPGSRLLTLSRDPAAGLKGDYLGAWLA
jgi:hypothetical protein